MRTLYGSLKENWNYYKKFGGFDRFLYDCLADTLRHDKRFDKSEKVRQNIIEEVALDYLSGAGSAIHIVCPIFLDFQLTRAYVFSNQ